MQAEQLYGIWELIECYAEFEEDGTRFYPYGEDAVGRITYHPQGYMSAFLSSAHRPPLTTDIAQVPAEEAKQALTSFDAYAGTYTLDLAQSTVTHHVEMARYPNWVGQDQLRYFTLEDEVLTIRSAPIAYAGKSMIVFVTWKKLV